MFDVSVMLTILAFALHIKRLEAFPKFSYKSGDCVAFQEILRNSSTAGGKTTAKERDGCGSGMPDNNSRADPHPLACRSIPGSIRNIMRLSGMDFQSFLK